MQTKATTGEPRSWALWSPPPTAALKKALKILVRPAMIASVETLYGTKAIVEISPGAQTRRGQCTMWLRYAPTSTSGLLVFGITPTGEIFWTGRIHVNGEQVCSRSGELSRPDAAAEIFAIARQFVRTFTGAAGI